MTNAIFLVTAAGNTVERDLEKRILRGVVFATTGLASDGMILLPAGIGTERYERDPIVTRRHLARASEPTAGEGPLVVARALALARTQMELTAEVQFADTQDGRDYAYLYGVNAEALPYMRGWSIEGPVLESTQANWTQARTLSGQYWDDTLAQRLRQRLTSVAVATRFELASVALVAAGADRGALTRACREGVRAAGAVLAELELAAAGTELAALREMVGAQAGRLASLEQEILALRRDGAAAAARGDTAAILAELTEMRKLVAREA